MKLPVAPDWFERRRIDATLTLLTEPHVDPLLRCNVWHVRGRARNLLVDTGMGIASLLRGAPDLFASVTLAVATHSHLDHVGGLHEFDHRQIHRDEAAALARPPEWGGLAREHYDAGLAAYFDAVGYPLAPLLLTAIPYAGFDPVTFLPTPCAATRQLQEGDVIDLGDRAFEVLHLPVHSPGSIGLWDARARVLFSGDAVYDGPLLDGLPGSNREDYLRTIARLRRLPVSIVHGGHDGSFGRARLLALLDDYERASEQAG